ncbi:MmgE/PrpD family protein [Streptacidiphilus sp. PAMC 29251]
MNENFGAALNEWMNGYSGALPVPAALVDDAAAAAADFLLCALITHSLGDGCEAAAVSAAGNSTALGPTASPVWWTTLRASTPEAARVNLLAGIAGDYDSVNYLAGGHLAAFLTPVLLTGTDTFLDDALGIQALATEFAVRLGLSTKAAMRENGFHATPVLGGLAAVYALARLRGMPTERLTWCLRLFLSTFRSDYDLLGSDGRLFQMGQAMRLAYAAVEEGASHSVIDRSAAREWWKPLAAMGVGTDTPAAASLPWLSAEARTSLKSVPCCAYFFEVLAAVSDLRRRLPTAKIQRLRVDLPRFMARAHRRSDGSAWLEPYDLVHNIAVCWLLGKDHWTPLAEVSTEAVRQVADVVTLHELDDDRAVRVIAVTTEGTFAEEAAGQREGHSRDGYGILPRKAAVLGELLGLELLPENSADDPYTLVRHLLDVCRSGTGIGCEEVRPANGELK